MARTKTSANNHPPGSKAPRKQLYNTPRKRLAAIVGGNTGSNTTKYTFAVNANYTKAQLREFANESLLGMQNDQKSKFFSIITKADISKPQFTQMVANAGKQQYNKLFAHLTMSGTSAEVDESIETARRRARMQYSEAINNIMDSHDPNADECKELVKALALALDATPNAPENVLSDEEKERLKRLKRKKALYSRYFPLPRSEEKYKKVQLRAAIRELMCDLFNADWKDISFLFDVDSINADYIILSLGLDLYVGSQMKASREDRKQMRKEIASVEERQIARQEAEVEIFRYYRSLGMFNSI